MSTPRKRPDRETFADLAARFTAPEIARQRGVAISTVRGWSAFYGIECRRAVIPSTDRSRYAKRNHTSPWRRRPHVETPANWNRRNAYER